jgi:1-acyl-sn-glycerol-3-phosphate acyltransferase
MRRSVKVILFLAISLFFLAVVSLFQLVWIVVRFRRQALQARITQVWAKILLIVIGIRVESLFHHHQFHRRHFLIVSNHQSYLDIIVIASLFPTLFVAKKEVRSWPLLGWLALLGGTVFVDRQAFRGGMNSAQEVAAVLRANVSVNVFPEGTSSDGTHVFPFKPSLLKAAIETGTVVLPLSINYLLVNGKPMTNETRDRVCWYGAMEFLPHFLHLLDVESILAAVVTHNIVAPAIDSTAQEIAQQCHDAVSAGLIRTDGITPQQKILMREIPLVAKQSLERDKKSLAQSS